MLISLIEAAENSLKAAMASIQIAKSQLKAMQDEAAEEARRAEKPTPPINSNACSKCGKNDFVEAPSMSGMSYLCRECGRTKGA